MDHSVVEIGCTAERLVYLQQPIGPLLVQNLAISDPDCVDIDVLAHCYFRHRRSGVGTPYDVNNRSLFLKSHYIH